jgi:4-hydroxybenzoate polyprenyltransferase/phosphoserine phosphatase
LHESIEQLPSRIPDCDIPLCIDLDGTLLRSDLLLESALSLLRRNPFYLLSFIVWLSHGKARLKREIALRANVDVRLLPYDSRVLTWLRDENIGRKKVLCSASDKLLVDAVAKHLDGFDTVLASDGLVNLSGARKAQALVENYSEYGFDYAGNARPDMQVWSHARRAIVVNASPALLRRTQKAFSVSRVFVREKSDVRVWVRALRLHQWLKNLLIFLPLLAAHMLFVPQAMQRSVLAFFCFGLCASGVYLLNDLLDLESDRRHPRKRLRPFAAGTLSLLAGLVAAPLLVLVSFALAWLLSPLFATVLFGYYALTLAYSFALKRIAMLDAIVLGTLYTARIIAGAVAAQVVLSFWLLAFSMFLFLSLAMLKRYTELRSLRDAGQTEASGRGYAVDDLPLIESLGGSSGFLSVLVLALYINSTASEVLYRHPQILWMLCPLLLYWVSRAWLIAHRGAMHDDPVVFALVDRGSRIILVLCGAAIVGAI